MPVVKSIQFEYLKEDKNGKATNSPIYLTKSPPTPIAHGANSISEKQYNLAKNTPVFQKLVEDGAIVSKNKFAVVEIQQGKKEESKPIDTAKANGGNKGNV